MVACRVRGLLHLITAFARGSLLEGVLSSFMTALWHCLLGEVAEEFLWRVLRALHVRSFCLNSQCSHFVRVVTFRDVLT